MTNYVLTLTHNCLDKTKRCLESVARQDLPTTAVVIDNGSSDGTVEYLTSDEFKGMALLYPENRGVSYGWNVGLDALFERDDAEHVLVIGNDTSLAPWTYSALLSANALFITGADCGMEPIPDRPEIFDITSHPDFSCFLIRKEAWEKIGPFDTRMVNYCGDCDYHARAHRLGIALFKTTVFYNHERSSTMNLASPEVRAALHARANADRQAFREKWGCIPGEPGYNDLFKPELFGRG